MTTALVMAAEGGDSGTFLVKPGIGLMIWTLIAFGATLLLLRKFAFPAIQQALDRRQRAIEDSIDAAERTRRDADALLQEYRERLREARAQAEHIIERANRAAEAEVNESVADARRRREELMQQARRDIEQETRRAIQEIRKEVADLTVTATEKVTRRALTEDDQHRLVEEALGELDFTALAGRSG
jgi:F-type H+-transporting ATPase subunit b